MITDVFDKSEDLPMQTVIICLQKESAADRRLIRYKVKQKFPLSLPDWGGYFVVYDYPYRMRIRY